MKREKVKKKPSESLARRDSSTRRSRPRSSAPMRVKRARKVRKYLRYYRSAHGFREPYKVICDGNFIAACVKLNLGDAKDVVAKYLGSNAKDVKVFTTRCVQDELRDCHCSAHPRQLHRFGVEDIHNRVVAVTVCPALLSRRIHRLLLHRAEVPLRVLLPLAHLPLAQGENSRCAY